MSLEVIRVRTRETLARPDIASLIMRGARVSGFPVPSAILAELLRDAASDNLGLFIGTVRNDPRAVVAGFLQTSAFWLAATIGMAYAEKAPVALVRFVGEALRGWFTEHGVRDVIVSNYGHSGHSDRAFMRGLAHFGQPLRTGSLIRFEW